VPFTLPIERLRRGDKVRNEIYQFFDKSGGNLKFALTLGQIALLVSPVQQQPMVTIGDYPAVTLQDARIRARRYAEIVAGGVSPIAKKDRGTSKTLDSVRAFADFWYESEIATKSLSSRTVTSVPWTRRRPRHRIAIRRPYGQGRGNFRLPG
jgi:hypothetical protein